MCEKLIEIMIVGGGNIISYIMFNVVYYIFFFLLYTI